jgi:hypothetical protein
MKRLSRGSVPTPTVSGDRPLGLAMVDTFRLVIVLLVMTLPVLQKLGYCSHP